MQASIEPDMKTEYMIWEVWFPAAGSRLVAAFYPGEVIGLWTQLKKSCMILELLDNVMKIVFIKLIFPVSIKHDNLKNGGWNTFVEYVVLFSPLWTSYGL